MQRSMDLTSLRCLINSISRFIHLATCRVSETLPAEKDFRNLVSLLKHLKPILDDAADLKAPDDVLSKESEVLDVAVNDTREFLEKWSPRMSKILCVLRCKGLVLKIHVSVIKLSHILCRLLESSPAASSLSDTQSCMQESQNLSVGQLSEHVEEVLKCQKEGKSPSAERLIVVIDSLNLRSNQEILNETIALHKEKQKAEENKMKGDSDQISQVINLMSHIRDYVFRLEKFEAVNGIQIPSYFRCPLSLELMSDPVIVASGQTYDRAAIQKWLDHGLLMCPKTGSLLAHKNLIPNYTVKALIANWCSENKVEFFKNPDKENKGEVRCHSEHISREDDSHFPLQRKNSTSRSSFEVEHGFEVQKVNEESHQISREEIDKLDESSPEHSYVHSRSESVSSVVSSIDCPPTEISGIWSKHDNVSERSGDLKPPGPTSPPSRASPSLSAKQYNSSKTRSGMFTSGNHNPSRTLSFPSESGSSDLTSISHVEKLINELESVSTDMQTAAAGEIRFLAKYNMENRIIIGQCGAIAPLISLLRSDVELAQEHAVTALLNLSINEEIKARIAEEGALDPLIHVLRTGNAAAKENAAAALFSISLLDDYRIKIGRSGAVKALVDLLGSGTVRGKKDAATALFNLSIFHENKARIVQAGAVKYLVGLLDPTLEMLDKAVALLANLSTITEGCSAIAREGGIPLLVEIVESGSQRGKENAASILLQLCINSPKYCRSILQEGAVPPLVALSQSGTPRAKEKAQQLLSHFRNQRESALVRGRS